MAVRIHRRISGVPTLVATLMYLREMEVLKFGVVGAGHIGKRHAEMIRRRPDCALEALADVRPRAACGVGEEVPFYGSLEAMLTAHPGLDVVSICTPNGLHAAQAIEALQAGCHVVIEKPMALSRADGEAVLHAALEAGRQVFCVMQNRYSPPSVWLKELLAAKQLGNIQLVTIECFWNRDDRYYVPTSWKGGLDLDGGTLFTQFSHFIDILYWLFGDVTDLTARFYDVAHAHCTDFEDSGIIAFELVKGGSGTFTFSTAVDRTNFASTLTILGEKGTVKVGGQYMNEVVYCDIQGYEMPELPEAGPANDYGHYKGSAANHHLVYDNVVAALRGNERIATNALEGLKVVDIIERMYAAGHRPLKPGVHAARQRAALAMV